MDKGWFVKPTIFSDVSNDMRIAQEEIFGPVLVIIPFENESDAVAIANDTPYGLAAYLQTGDPDRKERVSAKLKAVPCILMVVALNTALPLAATSNQAMVVKEV